jgi:hypothetical protein
MKIYWNSATSGDFGTAGNWTPSDVPLAFDQAFLTATGSAYTVTAQSDETVLTVNTSADATLDIGQGTRFTAEAGTGPGANNGTIDVTNATFAVAGTINNNGTIEINSGGSSAVFKLVGNTPAERGQTVL